MEERRWSRIRLVAFIGMFVGAGFSESLPFILSIFRGARDYCTQWREQTINILGCNINKFDCERKNIQNATELIYVTPQCCNVMLRILKYSQCILTVRRSAELQLHGQQSEAYPFAFKFNSPPYREILFLLITSNWKCYLILFTLFHQKNTGNDSFRSALQSAIGDRRAKEKERTHGGVSIIDQSPAMS